MLMRHNKTGGVYRIAMLAVDETTLSPVVIYSDVETGTIWTRRASEFFDGRFAPYFGPAAKPDAPGKEFLQ